MTETSSPSEKSPAESVLGRLVHVEAGEGAALLLSFVIFFMLLCGYYIMRPVRDEMGVAAGPDGLERMFYFVFLAMLAAVPVYGTIVAKFSRRQVVPIVYAFFISNLILFWALLDGRTGVPAGPMVAQVFFVWSSVFNLFVVSMFWVLMSELYDSARAKRLYGFIAAGGTAGAITGPAIARWLAGRLNPQDLLLVTALLLSLALIAVLVLRKASEGQTGAGNADRPAGGREILSGAKDVVRSPYLFKIALFILLANLIGTYFYLEQSRIVGETIADKAERVQFFASRDLAVNIGSLAIQLFVTGRVMERLGLPVALSALPVIATIGLAALAVAPSLDVVAAVMVAERSVAFSLTNPAVKVLWTAVPLDEKYKAQNFIDTVVYRGGDAASGWVFNSLAKSLGLGGALIALLSLPLALVWLFTGVALGREQHARAETRQSASA